MTTSKSCRSLEKRGYKSAIISMVIALVILGWVIQAMIGLERTLLDEDHYRGLIEDLNLYPALQGFLLKQLAEGREDLLSEDSLFNDAVQAAVSEAWVQQQTEAFIHETLLFAKGQRQRLLLVADLHDRERVFQEALLKGLLEQVPPQLEQLELPKAALNEFVNQLDFPDQVTVVNMSKDELPESAVRALNLLKLSRGLLLFLPFLLTALLILLLILWSGVAGGLMRAGGALIGSALSSLLLMTALRPSLAALLARKTEGVEALQALFADWPAASVAVTVGELRTVSYLFGLFGIFLLAAGLAAYAAARRGVVKVQS